MTRRTLGILAVVVVVAAATAGWLVARRLAADAGGGGRGHARITSEFSLVDDTGQAVTEKDFAGKWQLVFFGFTYCPDVCPTTLATVSAVLEELGDDADQVAPLFVTVDPERDTPAVLADYLANFDERIVGLTGSPEQIKAAAKAFRVYYAKVKQDDLPGGYTMDHSAFLYLMDPEGAYATHFSHQTDVAEMANAIRDFVHGARTS
jgi:cytochrome oxidase Cu insertion factor (SCO1/SenC/PrrC family)